MSGDELTVDRVEDGRLVVLEAADHRTFFVPSNWLPGRVVEGDVIRVIRVEQSESGGSGVTLRLEIDHEARRERERRIRDLRARIPKGPSGDLEL